MQLTFKPARLAGFAILAVASATVLSLGACTKSHDEKKSADTSSKPAAATPKDIVQGLVASASGNSVQVTQESGSATVDVGSSAKIIEYTNAQLTDFAAGNCVRVNFKPGPYPNAASAIAVQQNPPGNGDKCPQPKALASGSPGALLPAGPIQAVIGTVVSVTGNSIKVASTDANGKPAQTDMNVSDQTRFTKGATETSQAIAEGKCINASGTKDGGGTLQATFVTLIAANDGKCPWPAAKR
jgi:hypothetical protein